MKQAKMRIPKDILEGLEAVRISGKTNMFDVPRVIELALEIGYAETAFWLYDNRSSYCQGILRGFEPEEGIKE